MSTDDLRNALEIIGTFDDVQTMTRRTLEVSLLYTACGLLKDRNATAKRPVWRASFETVDIPHDAKHTLSA